MSCNTDQHHGAGLADDLSRVAMQIAMRRRTLGFIAGGFGTALLAGCGSGGDDSTAANTSAGASSGSTSTSTGTTTAAGTNGNSSSTGSGTSSGSTSGTTGSSGSSTTTGSSGSTASCAVDDPTETAGPYPADGTNTASGVTSDILTASGIVRSDIRSSFLSSTTTAAGIPVTLTLTLVNSASSCAPLSGYAIYLWHCDAAGNYSLYSAPGESYLRGVQITDGNGKVTFVTIFPACYSGRWPHIHLEVFASQAAATNGRNAKLTTQLAMPSEICTAVFTSASGIYSTSTRNLSQVTLARDNVFGDNSAAEIALQTPAFSGSVSEGYTATATVVLGALSSQ